MPLAMLSHCLKVLALVRTPASASLPGVHRPPVHLFTHHGAALHGGNALFAVLAWQQHQGVAAPRQVWRGRIERFHDLERLRPQSFALSRQLFAEYAMPEPAHACAGRFACCRAGPCAGAQRGTLYITRTRPNSAEQREAGGYVRRHSARQKEDRASRQAHLPGRVVCQLLGLCAIVLRHGAVARSNRPYVIKSPQAVRMLQPWLPPACGVSCLPGGKWEKL